MNLYRFLLSLSAGLLLGISSVSASSQYCTNEVLNPPKFGGCGASLCRAIQRAGKRNDLPTWKRAISASESYLQRYPECRSFINDCIACATAGKGSPQIKTYQVDRSLWKNSGDPLGNTLYYVPATALLSKTDKLIEEVNERCKKKDPGVCVTREFAKIKLCPKVVNITKRLFKTMLREKEPAFKHLIENNGEREAKVHLDEKSGRCYYGIRVEGTYRGSTINKWYWTWSETYTPVKGGGTKFLLDTISW